MIEGSEHAGATVVRACQLSTPQFRRFELKACRLQPARGMNRLALSRSDLGQLATSGAVAAATKLFVARSPALALRPAAPRRQSSSACVVTVSAVCRQGALQSCLLAPASLLWYVLTERALKKLSPNKPAASLCTSKATDPQLSFCLSRLVHGAPGAVIRAVLPVRTRLLENEKKNMFFTEI